MMSTRQLVADPKVLLKGVRDAHGRIAKLQEENEMLKTRLMALERGEKPPSNNMWEGPAPPPPRPGVPPPASICAQTDIDDQSFLMMDFGAKGGPGGRPKPPGAYMYAPPQPGSPTATESSMQAYNNPAFVEDSHAQQEASEWKQMYIDTLKHLRATKEELEKERQVGKQLETDLRHLQVGWEGEEQRAQQAAQHAHHAAHAAQQAAQQAAHDAAVAAQQRSQTPQTSYPPPHPHQQHQASGPTAHPLHSVDMEDDTRGGGDQRLMSLPMPPSAHQQAQQGHQIPHEFLQKYRQLGMGHVGEPLPQLKQEKSDVYVLDPGAPSLVNVPSKGPIVFDVRTGVTYTESPTLRSKPSVRMSHASMDSSFTSPSPSGSSSRMSSFLGKPKRRVEHSMSASMQGARDRKTGSPWMRSLFSCVAIDESATK